MSVPAEVVCDSFVSIFEGVDLTVILWWLLVGGTSLKWITFKLMLNIIHTFLSILNSISVYYNINLDYQLKCRKCKKKWKAVFYKYLGIYLSLFLIIDKPD